MLYYLQSRYYTPAMGRFISADNYPSTGQGLTGNNMFAYCGNNPVIREDSGSQLWHVAIGAAIGGILGGLTKFAECIGNGESIGQSIAQATVSAVCGAVGGALAATGIGAVGQAIIGGTLGAIESCATQFISTGSIDGSKVFGSAISGGIGGFLGGNGATHGSKFMDYHRKKLVEEIGSYGLDVAVERFGRHTWNWAKSNLFMPTLESVGKAFAAARIASPIVGIVLN